MVSSALKWCDGKFELFRLSEQGRLKKFLIEDAVHVDTALYANTPGYDTPRIVPNFSILHPDHRCW
jgi:hypothetical protein